MAMPSPSTAALIMVCPPERHIPVEVSGGWNNIPIEASVSSLITKNGLKEYEFRHASAQFQDLLGITRGGMGIMTRQRCVSQEPVCIVNNNNKGKVDWLRSAAALTFFASAKGVIAADATTSTLGHSFLHTQKTDLPDACSCTFCTLYRRYEEVSCFVVSSKTC